MEDEKSLFLCDLKYSACCQCDLAVIQHEQLTYWKLRLRKVDFDAIWGKEVYFPPTPYTLRSASSRAQIEGPLLLQKQTLCSSTKLLRVFNEFTVLQTGHMADQA